MKSGPKPKSIELREIEGAYRAGGKTKPEGVLPVVLGRPLASIIVQSDELAMSIFDEACDSLQSMGILCVEDSFLLNAYALNYRELVLCYQAMHKEGIEAETQRGGGKSSVYTSNSHKFLASHLRMMSELGLTPSARARMASPERKEDSNNPVDNLLKKLGGN